MTDSDWRQTILDRLSERNKRESGFHEVITNSEFFSPFFVVILFSRCAIAWYMSTEWNVSLSRDILGQRVLERNHQLKAENLTLSVENEKLRSGLGFGDIASTARIQALEKKLLDKQEELTDMHKRKGDNQQMIIDLNVKVTDLQKQLETRNNRWVWLCAMCRPESHHPRPLPA